jgi:hypothetical protein
MHRHAIEPHRARAAISWSQPSDPEYAAIAQERTQALSCCRLGGEQVAVDRKIVAELAPERLRM